MKGTLYVFGDSHAMPEKYVPPADSFWGLASKEIPTISKISNYAVGRNSLESVVHLVVCYLDKFTEDDLLFIGIPVLERFATFGEDASHPSLESFPADYNYITGKDFDVVKKGRTPELCGVRNISISANKGVANEYVVGYDRTWTEVQAIRDIYMLTEILNARKINYIFINLVQPFNVGLEGPVLGGMIRELKYSDRHILFTDTLHSVNFKINKPVDYDQYKYFGHHGPDGNKWFYEQVLRPRLAKLKII